MKKQMSWVQPYIARFNIYSLLINLMSQVYRMSTRATEMYCFDSLRDYAKSFAFSSSLISMDWELLARSSIPISSPSS